VDLNEPIHSYGVRSIGGYRPWIWFSKPALAVIAFLEIFENRSTLRMELIAIGNSKLVPKELFKGGVASLNTNERPTRHHELSNGLLLPVKVGSSSSCDIRSMSKCTLSGPRSSFNASVDLRAVTRFRPV
jgi:hypothetical protein